MISINRSIEKHGRICSGATISMYVCMYSAESAVFVRASSGQRTDHNVSLARCSCLDLGP